MKDQLIIQMQKSIEKELHQISLEDMTQFTCVSNSLLANICGIKSRHICIDGTL